MGPQVVECNLEPAGVPAAVAAVLSNGVEGSSEVGCDSPTAFAGALQEWRTAVCDSAAQQSGDSGDWANAADILQQAQPQYAGNPSGYIAAINELKDIASIPETDTTPAQQVEFQSDAEELDAFFGTPGLYISDTSQCPLPSGLGNAGNTGTGNTGNTGGGSP
jgi:hypothetical protein